MILPSYPELYLTWIFSATVDLFVWFFLSLSPALVSSFPANCFISSSFPSLDCVLAFFSFLSCFFKMSDVPSVSPLLFSSLRFFLSFFFSSSNFLRFFPFFLCFDLTDGSGFVSSSSPSPLSSLSASSSSSPSSSSSLLEESGSGAFFPKIYW